MLQLHGVGPIFGMGGFQLLPFYAAIRELGLRHHLVNDERTGAFAADAYARASGRVGVCDATLGPGATNLVTPLAESLNAGVPLIAIVGGTHRDYSGRHMTQECDQALILRPCAKLFLRVESPKRIPELVRRAFGVATAGRPGPVVIEVPEDIAHGTLECPDQELWIDERALAPGGRRFRADPNDVELAAALIRRSHRPLLLVGGGIHLSAAYEALRNFAEKLSVPVANTISGKGAIPCVHDLSVGVFGRYSRFANDLIQSADLLIAVGTKLGEIATKRYTLIPPATPLIHIDVEPREINRTCKAAVALVGDARLNLDDLSAAALVSDSIDRSAWITNVSTQRQLWTETSRSQLESDETPITVARLVHELNVCLPADAVLVTDGGFATHWTALFYDTKAAGRSYIADRGLASIGYGLPGAIGAKLARPGSAVVGLTGDGGLNMCLGDLETASRIGLPFVLIVVNNAASGYVKALQHFMLDGRYQSADLSDLEPDHLAEVILQALELDRPTIIDVKVTRNPARMLPGMDSRLTPTTS
jgi:acetolactate synthase-1/2/3 large subunit